MSATNLRRDKYLASPFTFHLSPFTFHLSPFTFAFCLCLGLAELSGYAIANPTYATNAKIVSHYLCGLKIDLGVSDPSLSAAFLIKICFKRLKADHKVVSIMVSLPTETITLVNSGILFLVEAI